MENLDSAINALRHQKQDIEKEISELQKRISNAPEGSIRMEKKYKQYQYYLRKNTKDSRGTYIPRKDNDSVILLVQKNYDIKVLEALKKQLKAIERFLKDYNPNAKQQVFDKLSEPRKSLINKGFLTDKEFVQQWLSKPYNKMGFGKDNPEYYTSKGERVRSKSELLIAEALIRYNIPFRYEYPVYNNGELMGVPDFNCLNVRTRKEHYWEHLGMLGDPNYLSKNLKKLERYTLANDFDESGLILTMETANHPINTKVIEKKIRRYLL
jgi:hypothetical protein